MTPRDWVYQELKRTFGDFDWDYVVEDDDQIDLLDQEPKENFLYLVARYRDDDNSFALSLYENLNDAKDFIKDEINYGDCMANGGRGGPDYESEWVILDVVERKVITVACHTTIEFVGE